MSEPGTLALVTITDHSDRRLTTYYAQEVYQTARAWLREAGALNHQTIEWINWLADSIADQRYETAGQLAHKLGLTFAFAWPAIDEYYVPQDPADLTGCEGCE